jgi:NADH-quinone oxidoreductase subunit N
MIARVLAQVDPTVDQVPTPSIEWIGLLPVIILAVGALVLLTITSLLRGHLFRGFYALYTIVIATTALISVFPVWARVQGWSQLWWIDLQHPDGAGPFSTIGGAVAVDGFGLFITVLLCASVIIAALLADSYLRREGLEGPEFYVLMLLSATGGVIMAMSNDLIVLFLGLETLSIAVYVLTAMHLRRAQAQEGALKYFVLGSFSSAFFLYGIALIYGATGSTNFIQIREYMAANVPVHIGLLLLGLVMLLVGLGFKVAAVPFHAWSPDAYDGAPTPAVVYMAAGVKAAAFAGIVRVFMVVFSNYAADWQPVVYTLAILSMVGGALLGIVQSNVKRMLAYSSINHAGFILIAVEAASARGIEAVLFYLAAYTFMIAGTFAIVTVIGRKGDRRHQLSDYRGLARANPVLALVMAVLLLAQAGVPFTSGFFAKFYAITAAVDAGSWPLALVAMVTAVIAAFLYLRIVVAMYMSDPEHADPTPPVALEGGPVTVPLAAWIGIGACFVITLFVGIVPSSVLDPARDARPAVVQVADPIPAGPGVLPPGVTLDPGPDPTADVGTPGG